jgi:hypothetical protein
MKSGVRAERLGIDVYVRSMSLEPPLGCKDAGFLKVLSAVTDECAFPSQTRSAALSLGTFDLARQRRRRLVEAR